MQMLENLNWRGALTIARHCGIIRPQSFLFLSLYYVVTVLNAALDGISLAMLLNLLTGKVDASGDLIMHYAVSGLEHFGLNNGADSVLFLVIGLASLRALLYFLLQVADGYLLAYLRRRIQNNAFAHVLNGAWEDLRQIRVGQYVGAVTQETAVVIKYYVSALRAGYYLLTGATLGLVAIILSPQLTVLLALAGIPVLAIFHLLFTLQSRISSRQTSERQAFAADVTERFSNLLQIKVDGHLTRHIETGLRHQNEVTRLEVKLGYCQAFIATLKIALPIVGLLFFYAWTLWQRRSIADTLHIFAGVGILGLRTAQQFDNLLSMFGNLSLVSGSIAPVCSIFSLRPDPVRQPIGETIKRLKIDAIAYRYRDDAEEKTVTFSAERGSPFFVRGPSGAGKTTLANLVTGLISPHKGRIEFVGDSGREYSAAEFRVRSGYVTQDIQLFHGTVRQNLASFSETAAEDAELWRHLALAGADHFVRKLGGLDAVIAEAGRSLSGGERRRLGIARALAGNPQILILDEVTSGLDAERKAEIMLAIGQLARSYLTLVITHDPPGAGESELRTIFVGTDATPTGQTAGKQPLQA